jgi:hypothetical protein
MLMLYLLVYWIVMFINVNFVGAMCTIDKIIIVELLAIRLHLFGLQHLLRHSTN